MYTRSTIVNSAGKNLINWAVIPFSFLHARTERAHTWKQRQCLKKLPPQRFVYTCINHENNERTIRTARRIVICNIAPANRSGMKTSGWIIYYIIFPGCFFLCLTIVSPMKLFPYRSIGLPIPATLSAVVVSGFCWWARQRWQTCKEFRCYHANVIPPRTQKLANLVANTPYSPPFWCVLDSSGNIITLLGSILDRIRVVMQGTTNFKRELFELEDGGTVGLDWDQLNNPGNTEDAGTTDSVSSCRGLLESEIVLYSTHMFDNWQDSTTSQEQGLGWIWSMKLVVVLSYILGSFRFIMHTPMTQWQFSLALVWMMWQMMDDLCCSWVHRQTVLTPW